MEEEKDFLRWYKNKMEQNAQDPPEAVWDKISDQLDVDDVWKNISKELDDKDRALAGRQTGYYAAAAIGLLIALLAGLIGFNKYGQISSEEITQAENILDDTESLHDSTSRITEKSRLGLDKSSQVESQNKQKENPFSEDNTAKILQRSARKSSADKIASPQNSQFEDNAPASEAQVANTPPPSFEKNKIVVAGGDEISFLERRSPSTAFYLPELGLIIADSSALLESRSALDSSLTASEDKEDKEEHRRSLKIGLTASAKNTWLLNKTTYRGLEKHTLNTTVPDFGKDVGLLVEYSFSKKLGLQGEFILSEMGQKYKEYRNGKYVTRAVDLEYLSVNFLFKYKINRLIGETDSNLIIGTFGSSLRSAGEFINNEPVHRPDQLLKHNFGAVLGYEFNHEVLKNLVFTSGLRFNYGVVNIHEDKLNRTFTGSLDINLALKYNINLKKP